MKPDTTKCELHEDLLDYLYEEMTSQQRVVYQRHLDTCATCTTELEGLHRLRTELRAWDVVTSPAIEIVIPRSPWQALKECFMLFPAWGRGAFALSAAAAMLLMAFGAFSLLRGTQPNAPAVAQTPVTITPGSMQPASLTPEVQAQIAAAVAKAVEQERQAWRAQLAAYESRTAEQQVRVQTVARQLRELQSRHDALLADQQPSLRRLMAEYSDTGNGTNER
ncbi:MAG: hypothetical protein HOP19_02620 [Acidobacteria bacterium]|nr:hypothetical protein [Acidobacteriota bacterium]